MSDAINVLDHGYIRLVESMGSDLSITRSARVSYDAAWRAGSDTGSDERLIRYLWLNNHVSPFEAVTFTFDVKAPIFVFRQWMRHRWSFNEVSGRYTEMPDEFYVPAADKIGVQSKSSKQARVMDGEARPGPRDLMQMSMNSAFGVYEALLSDGVPRELARTVLPLGTYSKMFATVNLRSVLHFLDQRTHEHAQYEIKVYADALLDLIRPIVPVAVAAWEEGNAPRS